VWQNERSGLVAASGRSHGDTSTASTRRQLVALGSGKPVDVRRNLPISTRPRFSPSYKAPRPSGHTDEADWPAMRSSR
jgi:hypothetical protein